MQRLEQRSVAVPRSWEKPGAKKKKKDSLQSFQKITPSLTSRPVRGYICVALGHDMNGSLFSSNGKPMQEAPLCKKIMEMCEKC